MSNGGVRMAKGGDNFRLVKDEEFLRRIRESGDPDYEFLDESKTGF